MSLKPFQRSDRISNSIHKEVAALMRQKTEIPIWQQATVTGVAVSKDLKHAKIYVSTLDEKNVKSVIKELNKTTKTMRWLLARNLNLRSTPAITFVFDETLIKGPKISALIDEGIEKQIEQDN